MDAELAEGDRHLDDTARGVPDTGEAFVPKVGSGLVIKRVEHVHGNGAAPELRLKSAARTTQTTPASLHTYPSSERRRGPSDRCEDESPNRGCQQAGFSTSPDLRPVREVNLPDVASTRSGLGVAGVQPVTVILKMTAARCTRWSDDDAKARQA